MSDYGYLSSTNGIESVENYYILNMATQALKNQVGDGMEFELIYQALLDSISQQSNNSNISEKTETSNVVIGRTRAGQSLLDIPLRTQGSISSIFNINYNSSIEEVNTSSSDVTMQKIYDTVNKYAKEYDVDPKLILAVIRTESDFNSNTVSSAGAKGLMQLMPSVCMDYNVSDPFDIDQNIRGGVQLLRDHLNNYNGDIGKTLMAYNAGAGTMQSRGVNSIEDLYKMPKETQNYVPKVMYYYNNGADAEYYKV